MSKESYLNGFCKTSVAHGIDPYALAHISMQKKAQDAGGGIWKSVSDVIDNIKQKWEGIDPSYKPLVGSLVGGGVGAGTGALAGKLFGFGAGRGALAGLGLGGIGGALYGANSASNQLEALRKADAESASKTLSDTTKDYEDRLQNQAVAGQKALDEAKAQGSRDVAATKKDYEGRMSGLVAKHKAEGAAAAKKHQDAVDRLRSQIKGLEEARKTDAAGFDVERGKLNNALEGRLATEQAEHAKALKALADKHDAKIKGMTEAHAKALQGMTADRDSVRKELNASNKANAGLQARLDTMLNRLSPEELSGMGDAERKAVLDAASAQLKDYSDYVGSIKDVNLRKAYEKRHYSPEQIDAIMARRGSMARNLAELNLREDINAANLSNEALSAKQQEVMAQIANLHKLLEQMNSGAIDTGKIQVRDK